MGNHNVPSGLPLKFLGALSPLSESSTNTPLLSSQNALVCSVRSHDLVPRMAFCHSGGYPSVPLEISHNLSTFILQR